jgi:hypothetical protein
MRLLGFGAVLGGKFYSRNRLNWLEKGLCLASGPNCPEGRYLARPRSLGLTPHDAAPLAILGSSLRPQLHIHPTAPVTGLSGDSLPPTAGTLHHLMIKIKLLFNQEETWVTYSITNTTRTNKQRHYSKGIEPKAQQDGRWLQWLGSHPND